MLGSCTTIVKLPQNNSKLLRGLASIKAVSLDIGCSTGVVFRAKQVPAIAVLLRLGQCIDEELFPRKTRTIECAA